jgi:hypothetical protein
MAGGTVSPAGLPAACRSLGTLEPAAVPMNRDYGGQALNLELPSGGPSSFTCADFAVAGGGRQSGVRDLQSQGPGRRPETEKARAMPWFGRSEAIIIRSAL